MSEDEAVAARLTRPRWRYTVLQPCKRLAGHSQVVCTWSVDYHTVGGVYIVKDGTL